MSNGKKIMASELAANRKKLPRGKAFEKGNKANPTGRPKLTPEEMDLIAACKAKTPEALAVIEKLMTESQSDKVKLSAALSIIERAWGKPIQPTTVSAPDGGAVSIQVSFVGIP